MDYIAIIIFTTVAAVAAIVAYGLTSTYYKANLKLALERELKLTDQHRNLADQLADVQDKLTDTRQQKLVAEALIEADKNSRQKETTELNERLSQQQLSLNKQQMEISDQIAQVATLKTQLEEQRVVSANKLEDFHHAKKQLNADFEVLANRIFDEKTEKFDKSNKASLDGVINPLREQLVDFKKKVEDVYDKDSKERISLLAELGQLKNLNQKMTDEALNLTKALKGDNKAQGNWGEVILERVLEESGLHKGREYDTQVSLKSEQGQRRSPDVVVRLPESKDIIIDSKVSLVHYERFCNTEDDIERQQALKDHVASVRSHINNLSFKDYENLEGINTLDFVFIFIPIESAFMAAFEHDQSMFKEAYEKNIIVVSPTTLLATLRTVQSIWRYERQNKNAEEIARQAGAMHDKFVAFVTDLDKISDHLARAGLAHESAMNKLQSGKGNLVNSTLRLEKLGAKTKKKIPVSVLQADDADTIESVESEGGDDVLAMPVAEE